MLERQVHSLVYEYAGAWNRHDAEELAALYADDALYEDLLLPVALHGSPAIRGHVRQVFSDSSDAVLALGAEPLASGDRACFEWLMVGERDGQTREVRGVSVMLIEDGRIVRQTDYPHPTAPDTEGRVATTARAAPAPVEDNVAWGE